jgi:hypothetical protein
MSTLFGATVIAGISPSTMGQFSGRRTKRAGDSPVSVLSGLVFGRFPTYSGSKSKQLPTATRGFWNFTVEPSEKKNDFADLRVMILSII